MIKEIWTGAVYIDENGNVYDMSDNYQVSNKERIKYLNYEHHQGKIKIVKIPKSHQNRRYYKVSLFYNHKKIDCVFHRLVLSSFVPNSKTYKCINHKDCNTHNNQLDNLEWCDYTYNNIYNDRAVNASKLLKGKTNTSNSKPVLQYSLDGTLIKEWPSVAEITRVLGYKSPNIINCCNHKPKYYTSHGFKWEYKSIAS